MTRTWMIVALVAGFGSVARAQPGLQAPIAPDAPLVLHKEGLLAAGVSLELMDLGPFQAFTSHGSAIGADIGIALQVDLGEHWALKVPIEFGFGGSKNGAHYGELAVVPGVVYRFRDRDGQRWVPYVGGGLRFGVVSIGRTLVGKPLTDPVVVACCHDWGGHFGDGDGGGGDPYLEDASVTGGGISPEAWAGFAWNRTRWFSVQLAGAVAYERVLSTTVVIARETVGVRLTF